MTVTFLPKNETAWQLQDEFYHAENLFYDFKSPICIGKIFGAEYGWRRFGFAFAAHLGPFAARAASRHVKDTYFYCLRSYAPDATKEQKAKSAGKRKKQLAQEVQ